jgi:hypothetical protein
MVRAFVAERIRRIEEAQTAALNEIPPDRSHGGLIDFVAGPGFPDPRADALLDALMAPSNRDPEPRAQLRDVYRSFRSAVARHLRHTNPQAPPPMVRQAAHALICLAYGHATMSDPGLTTREVAHVREAAHSIIDGLTKRS